MVEIGVMQTHAKDCRSHQHQERDLGQTLSEPLKGASPADTLISDLWPPHQ